MGQRFEKNGRQYITFRDKNVRRKSKKKHRWEKTVKKIGTVMGNNG